MRDKIITTAKKKKAQTPSNPVSGLISRILKPFLQTATYIVNPFTKRLKLPFRIIKHKLRLTINRLGKRRIKWACFGIVILAVFVLAIGSVFYMRSLITASYKLPVNEQALIGQPDKSLLSQFTYDAKSKTYFLSKSAINSSGSALPSRR